MSLGKQYKTIKLLYKGKLYREYNHNGARREILNFMDEQTQMIPVTKQHLYYFEVESIASKNIGNPIVAIDKSGARNIFDSVSDAAAVTGISPRKIYYLLRPNLAINKRKHYDIEFEWAD